MLIVSICSKNKKAFNDPGPGLASTFLVTCLMDDQVFHSLNNYEGIGTREATFGDSDVIITGIAWIETYGKPGLTCF